MQNQKDEQESCSAMVECREFETNLLEEKPVKLKHLNKKYSQTTDILKKNWTKEYNFIWMCIIMITTWTLICWFYQCLDGLFSLILVPLGSIPELPATSCQEINKNEGKKLDSGKYWMSLSGKIDHVYCNMSTVPEGKFNPCTSIIIIYSEHHTCNTSWGTKFLGPQPYNATATGRSQRPP